MAYDVTTIPAVGFGTKRSEYIRLKDNDVFLYGNHLQQAFRGLHLRTHPDADVAASKVMLVHADEIIMDDGTRLASWDRLVADLAAAGAGGLDTGAEAASVWYEIYGIAKDDGTKALLLHRALDYSPDTSFVTNDTSRALRRATGTATDRLAQGIQFANSGPLEFLDVQLHRAGAVSGRIWFSIQASSASDADGTPLATTDKLDAAVVNTSSQTVRFIFRTPFTPSASVQYHLVLEGDYTRSDTVNISWRGAAAGGYGSGVAREYNGTTWANASGVGDFWFKANLVRNSAAVTMPSTYTKKALLGYVFNNSSSDLVPCYQHERLVTVDRATITSGLTATLPTLHDLSAFIPPGPVTVLLLASNTGAGNSVVLGAVPQGYSARVGQVGVGAAGLTGAFVPFLTTHQGLYASVDAGTGTVYLSGWEY